MTASRPSGRQFAMYTTLISAEQLQALHAPPRRALMVFDCSFDLMNPAAGEKQYLQAHIPGAVYAAPGPRAERQGHARRRTAQPQPHADAASGGRHPLPSREKFAMWLSSVGFANDMQAVVYDRNGANYCGRLWWMLKWAGHDAVAVLDGGLQAWQAAGGEVRQRRRAVALPVQLRAAATPLRAPGRRTQDVASRARHGRPDAGRCARAAALPRRSGAAGPGGRPHPRRAEPALRAEHRRRRPLQAAAAAARRVRAAAGRAATRPRVVHHCGSGVSAVPNLLAMELAGFAPTGLYAGSWSEWCRDPELPVEKG